MKKKFLGLLAGVAIIGGTLGASVPAAHADEDHCDWDVTTILGSPQNDVLNGTLCRDLILGFNGNDVLRGKQGEDTLRGGRGNDRVIGVDTFFPESDQVAGGPGFDTCIGDILDNFVNCEVVIETT
jgi:Ca2+-binding RTX toxin-like protein